MCHEQEGRREGCQRNIRHHRGSALRGYKVQLVGFGGFETKAREARMGRNPKTKEPIEIPATTVPVFKPGKALKDQISK